MPQHPAQPKQHSTAVRFVVLLGMVSLFADMTYESARSITGPYLALLGASGLVVGLTAGLGELCGYGLRVLTGLFSDRTRKYWALTIVGYAINLAAVPLLALANRWEIAAALIIAERFGKAVRSPSRDVLLSHGAAAMGSGWGFALHEAMDQVGALLGPLIVMLVLALNGSYPLAFALLAVPAGLAMAVLLLARFWYPDPGELEPRAAAPAAGGRFARAYWLYLIAAGLIAAGFADFPLIAFHARTHGIVADLWIPLLYSIAMGVDALAALAFGRWFDRVGIRSLMTAVVLSAPFALFAFSDSSVGLIIGVILWGIGMGAQESILRASVAKLVPAHRRGAGYGIFNAGFGVAWFAGSALIGLLYDLSIPAVMALSLALQLASLPLLALVGKRAVLSTPAD